METKGAPRDFTLGKRLHFFTGHISDIDLSRRLFLLFSLSLVGILTLVPLGLLALVEKSYALGGFDLLLAGILTLNLVHARAFRRFDTNIVLGITFTAALFIFAFVTGGKNQSAFVWYYTFPLISSFLLGKKKGLAVNLLMLVPVSLLFLAPGSHPFLAEYDFDFKVRFFPSYLVVVFFAFLAEHAREESRSTAQEAYDLLDHRVQERTVELESANVELEEEIGRRKRTERELSERVVLLALASDIGRALTVSDSLGSILKKCTDVIVNHLDAAFARIWILSESEGVLVLRASSGMYTHLNGPHSRIPLGEMKIGRIARDEEPVLSNAVVGDPNISDQKWARREGMISFAGHPLHLSGKLIGVMGLFAKKPMSPSVLSSLASVADQIAIGIDRKRSEEELAYSEDFLRSIVNTEPECVKLVDGEGILLDMNASGLKMVEAESLDQVVNKSFLSFVHQDHREAVKAFTKRASRGEGGVMQFQIVGLKGTTRWLESHSVPFEDRRENRPLVLSVTRDITERKEAEEHLRKVKEDLEKHNEELQKLDKMKSAFVYAVSHELKTPVSKHLMQLEILKPILKRFDLSRMEKDSIRVMEESIYRQQGVVRNLLDLTRLESGKRPYKIEDVHLDELVGMVKKEYEYALKSFNVAFETTIPDIRLQTDREMLWHVLSNLTNNAIKFRRGDVQARISITAETRGNTVLINIKDNGVGLGTEEMGKVFDRFYQSSSSIEGTGVGLTICRMIVEGLGGKITLASEGSNLGFEATVELPVKFS